MPWAADEGRNVDDGFRIDNVSFRHVVVIVIVHDAELIENVEAPVVLLAETWPLGVLSLGRVMDRHVMGWHVMGWRVVGGVG